MAMWLALPAIALDYWRAWDRLPLQMASHFDRHLQPNAWMGRESALELALGMTFGMLLLFTLGAMFTRASKTSSFWPVMVIFYFVLCIEWYAHDWVIVHNLG